MNTIQIFTARIYKRRIVRKHMFRYILTLFVIFIFMQLFHKFEMCRENEIDDHITLRISLTPEEISQYRINKPLYNLKFPAQLKNKLILEGDGKSVNQYQIRAKIVEKESILRPMRSGENSDEYEDIKKKKLNDNNSITDQKRSSDEQGLLISLGLCRFGLIAQSIQLTSTNRSSGYQLVSELFLWRKNINQVLYIPLDKTLLPTHSVFMKGVLLGVNEELPEEVKEDFKVIGLTHILVASGYNVMIITVATLWITKWLMSFKQSRIVTIIVVWTYAILVGMTPPIIRASLMMTVLLLSQLHGRQVISTWTLIFSGLLILILSPKCIFNLSFQLSFLATAGLVFLAQQLNVFFPSVSDKIKITSVRNLLIAMRENFLTTVSAMLLTAPLIAFHFQQLSIISVVANTVLLLFVPILMLLGFLLIVAWIINPFLGYMIGYLINGLLLLFFKLINIFSTPWWATISISPNGWSVVIFYVGLFIVMYYFSHFSTPRKEESINDLW